MSRKQERLLTENIFQPKMDFDSLLENRNCFSIRAIVDSIYYVTLIFVVGSSIVGAPFVHFWNYDREDTGLLTPSGFVWVGITNYLVGVLFLLIVYFAVRRLKFYSLTNIVKQQVALITLGIISTLAPTTLVYHYPELRLDSSIILSWTSLSTLITTTVIFWAIFINFPRRYLESTSPYSMGLIIQELQIIHENLNQSSQSKMSFLLAKNQINHEARRLRFYINSLLVVLLSKAPEYDHQINTVAQWYNILRKQLVTQDIFELQEFNRHLDQFRSEFSLFPLSRYKTSHSSAHRFSYKLLRFIDSFSFLTVTSELYSFPKLRTTWRRVGLPIHTTTQSLKGISLAIKAKVIKEHIKISNEFELISAQQKLTSVFIVTLLITVFLGIQYLKFLGDKSLDSIGLEGLKLILFLGPIAFGTGVIIRRAEKKIREAGIDATYNSYLYRLEFGVSSVLITTMLLFRSQERFLKIINTFANNFSTSITLLLSALALTLLFIYLRPPAEQRKTEVASSF